MKAQRFSGRPDMAHDPQAGLGGLLRKVPVVPVLVIERVEDAVPLARALIGGGLTVLEITLRTEAAADCIRAIRAELPDVVVGSGTILDAKQLTLSQELGCAFAVSPGSTPSLIAAARDHAIPLLPGSATASEAMLLAEQGYRLQKFFPAEPSGGAAYLSSLASPLPQVKFCPTGGLTEENAPNYLKLSNVITVGGSWMAPRKHIADGNWPAITKLAFASSSLKPAR
jgi:2-dehydro-3-deoxyphosphogluconate aldolase / (4S)-4-hydroxy-2-oxoglutarate aldolase